MNDLIISNHTGGRLANQLYYVLQAFVISKNNNMSCKYTMSNTLCKATDITKYAKTLNIEKYVSFDNQHIDAFQPLNMYFQEFNKDFLEYDLNAFIDETILRSDIIQTSLKNNSRSNSSVAMHVRNGDYINLKIYQCFDKIDYINRAIQHIASEINEIDIYSDDIDMTMTQFDAILKKRFAKVHYHVSDSNDPISDFCELSTYKNKIMWNSTFSWWTGFIASRLFADGTFICPVNYFSNETSYTRTPKNWIHL